MQVWWLLTHELLIFQPNLLQFASASEMISVFHPTLKNRFHRDEASSTLAESSTHKHTAKCQCHYLNATNTRVICRHCRHSSKQQCWNLSATYIHANNVQACCEHPPAVQRCEVRWAEREHQCFYSAGACHSPNHKKIMLLTILKDLWIRWRSLSQQHLIGWRST